MLWTTVGRWDSGAEWSERAAIADSLWSLSQNCWLFELGLCGFGS